MLGKWPMRRPCAGGKERRSIMHQPGPNGSVTALQIPNKMQW